MEFVLASLQKVILKKLLPINRVRNDPPGHSRSISCVIRCSVVDRKFLLDLYPCLPVTVGAVVANLPLS